jgi:hypothetical protein
MDSLSLRERAAAVRRTGEGNRKKRKYRDLYIVRDPSPLAPLPGGEGNWLFILFIIKSSLAGEAC